MDIAPLTLEKIHHWHTLAILKYIHTSEQSKHARLIWDYTRIVCHTWGVTSTETQQHIVAIYSTTVKPQVLVVLTMIHPPVSHHFHHPALRPSPAPRGQERKRLCGAWAEAPGAREAQPQGQAEHLMPLFVLLGAAPWKLDEVLFDIYIYLL